MERVDVRPITDVETLRAVEDLQQRVWGMPDRDVIPYHQLLAAGGAGGVILGAFVPDGTVVGFCYGFVGLREGRPILYSHMAGVAEQWRGTGVGFLLKRAQREAALTRGLDRIIWTFDALQAPNAHFNLHKLGAEARRYYVNYYGEMPDVLNRGLASDRLEVDWLLRTPRVTKLMGEAVSGVAPPAPRDASGVDGAPLALEASGDPLRPRMPAALPGAPLVRLAVPDDFAGVRHRDEALAQRWREATRLVFVEYFGRGYAAVDFLRSAPVGFYVLRASSAREGRAD